MAATFGVEPAGDNLLMINMWTARVVVDGVVATTAICYEGHGRAAIRDTIGRAGGIPPRTRVEISRV